MTLDELVNALEGVLGATIHEKGYFEGGDILGQHRLWISGFIENSHCILQTALQDNVEPLVIDLLLLPIRIAPTCVRERVKLKIAIYDAIAEGKLYEASCIIVQLKDFSCVKFLAQKMRDNDEHSA